MEAGIHHSTYRADMALRQTRAEKVRLALFVSAVLIFPFFADRYALTLANQIAIATVGAIGLNILVGYTGQISLGQGGFMAVGAYTAALLTVNLDMHWALSIVVAALVGAAVGVIFGVPSLRLKGLYLAIATLAAQEIILWVVTHADALTGGKEAIVVPDPQLLGWSLRDDFNFYWLGAGCAALAALANLNLLRTHYGRAFVAIRDQDIAASAMGVDVFRTKLVAFALSSGIVAVAGALLAHYRGIVTWERFTIDISILYLSMIIIGGLGSVSGSFFGAVLLTLLPAMITEVGYGLSEAIPSIDATIPYVQQAVFGLTIMLFLIFEPRGLHEIWKNIKDYFWLWPFDYER
ncbi:MAG: branched-chain amino acid ABC transporter permease [Myxococcales bacterium]|nr:branched-chain amino acid ABC transporter permease [Myxococcales bacterium]